MSNNNHHIVKTIASRIVIHGQPAKIWDNITNVNIEQFGDPLIFKWLDIPKPLSAEMILEGKGGKRIAYFDNGKKFIQEIVVWKPFTEYAFSFNPEKGFKVLYVFELSAGVFRMLNGAYYLYTENEQTTLTLTSTFSIDKRLYFLFILPVRTILKIFQRFLLKSIKENVE